MTSAPKLTAQQVKDETQRSQTATMDMRRETGGMILNNDAEIVAASPLAVRYETLVRVSRAVGVHGNLKELFGVLANELSGVVQFYVVGVSLGGEGTDT